jgi:hypothetical protein
MCGTPIACISSRTTSCDARRGGGARLSGRSLEIASGSSGRSAWSGQVRLSEDFDELPDDIAEAFGAT